MKKLLFLISFSIVALMLNTDYASAQEDIVKLWPDGAPGAIYDPEYNEISYEVDDGSSRIQNVTDPEMFVFLPSEPDSVKPAVIICPGGGYGRLAIQHEGYDIAHWLNNNGIAAFVLKYRLPSDQIMEDKSIGPLQDAQRAMRLVRSKSHEWNINPDKIGIMGFSAGGHLAASLSTHYDNQVYRPEYKVSARPDFSLLIYPVISFDATISHLGSARNLIGENLPEEKIREFSNENHVNRDTPQAFLIHSRDDGSVPVENSIRYLLALKEYKVPGELHIYTSGGHGYGMAPMGGTESTWPGLCLKWLRQQELISY